MNHIVELLIAERDRLNRAIEALQPIKRRGRPPKSAAALVTPTAKPKSRKPRSAAARKAQSARMKAYWAARKKQEKRGS
jgi:hypothetical protein